MKRVLRLPAYFDPEQAASSFLWKNLGDSLAESNVYSVVYIPVPTRGVSSEVRAYYKSNREETRHNGKMIIHRFPMFAEGKNPVFRALRYVIQGVIQFNKAVFAKDALSCNVLFIVSTPPIQGAMAALVKKCRKDHIPFIYNLFKFL